MRFATILLFFFLIVVLTAHGLNETTNGSVQGMQEENKSWQNTTAWNESGMMMNLTNVSGIVRVNGDAVYDEKRIENQCDIVPMVEVEKETYTITEKVAFRNRVSNKSISFLMEYWIEDGEGNVLKKPIQTRNTNKKQFTPRFEGGELELVIKNRLLWVPCNNTNVETQAMKRVHVTNPDAPDDLEEVEAPLVVKAVPKQKKKSAQPKEQEVTIRKTATKKPAKVEEKAAMPPALRQGRNYTRAVRIPSQAGERNIKEVPRSWAEEDLLYVGPSKRSRPYAAYMLFAVLLLVIVVLVKKQWRSPLGLLSK